MALEQKDYCDNMECDERGMGSCANQALAKLQEKRQEARELERARKIKDLQSHEEVSPLGFLSLSWAEHHFELGSSPVSGQNTDLAIGNVDKLVEDAKKGDQHAIELLFTPVRLLEEGDTQEVKEQVKRARDENPVIEDCLFVFLDPSQRELRKNGLYLSLNKADFDEKTGLIDNKSTLVLKSRRTREEITTADIPIAEVCIEDVKLASWAQKDERCSLEKEETEEGIPEFKFTILPQVHPLQIEVQ